ncbi:uncharacterized protein LOC114952001 [Acropora millepora]|uniref:uncharacterized protein LOC114952001 n=1 Tax=Acropora millepora TaxID=45264 RepID=UPI001CF4D4C1|nr:uncharacterized protein LOC114952001 [Acropora millepora]XP_044182756.1 uncharacterized protein LOC114952001 [Acropora millepora]
MAEGGHDFIKENTRQKQRNLTLDWEGIDAESLRKLKQTRGSKRGIVTRAQEEIRLLMTDSSNVLIVKEKLEHLHKAFQEFARAHVEYHNRLNDECDIDESEEYYKSVDQANGRLECEISSWIIACNRSRFETPLAAATREEIDDVTPDDSISNVGSRARSRHSRRSKSSSGRSKGSAASSVQSARAKAAAKKAMLEVEARKLENWQALKKEELALEMKKKGLELETEIAKAAAEELAYAQVENDAREPLSDFEKPYVKEPREFITDAAQNINFRREELEVPAKSERNTAEPQSSPVAREFPRSVANDVAPTNYNTPAARFAQIPTAKVKSECYEPTQNATFGDVAVRQLLDAQYFQNQQLQALIQRQQESTLALTLPQPNVPVFSGNPIEYWTFIRAFENLIDRKTTSESARLYYLVQYTSGDVQDLVKSCLSIGDDSGYQTARKLLQKAYGSSYKIANAYVKKLTSGPAIKAEDGEGLRKLSIALTGCKNTLTEIGYLNKLENPDTLRTIVQRLPFGLRQRWRDVADNITETQNREITIADLSDFVNAEARAATHAIFGDLSSHAPLSQGGSGVRRRPQSPTKSSFATNVGVNPNRTGDEEQKTQANRKCPLCKSNHWLSQCNNFKEKSLAARWQFVTSRGLCANCLVAGHLANSCPKKGFCRVTGCNGKHSSYLHPKSQVPGSVSGNHNSPTSEAHSQSPNQENGQSTFNGYVKGRMDHRSSSASLAIIPVKVKAPGNDLIIETYAFLDNGSNVSFCSEELATQLGLSGRPTSLSLTTMDREDNRSASRIVSLQVMDLEEENAVEMPCVFTRPKLPVSAKNGARQEDIDRWPHLSGVKLPKIDSNVGLLIGSDVPEALEPKEIRPSNGGPYATRTILGWVVNGPLGRIHSSAPATANFIRADAELTEQFRSYCNMEFNDSVYSNDISMSSNDKRALEIMSQTAVLKEGHYEIALPWKEETPYLHNNKAVAEHRLRSLKKRLLLDPDLLFKYKECMEDLLEKGYATSAPPVSTPGKTWYLPHHAVVHPAKPGKVRVVFDCSAKYRGLSLNDQLLQGPDLTNPLVGVLTRFRQEPIAIMSDIEAMFHQVRVRSDDCDALRFLWWQKGDLNSRPQEYKMRVHLFGGVSSPSCASFALQKTAKDNRAEFSPEAINTVKRDFYVDDCLKSVGSEHGAISLVKELTSLLSKGGFRLTKWLSNSRKVIESIPESERAKSVKDLDFDQTLIERALGVKWHVASDTFRFSIVVKDRPPTRRGILSIVSSVYDPLGFVAPFVLQAKILLQDLCRKNFGWDDQIPEKELMRWTSWLEELPKLEQFSLERCLKQSDCAGIVSCQLHHFSDASEVAYGAVSYLRLVDSQGNIRCSFLMGKSRLAPLKPLTIPRMELSAAVLSTRLDAMMRQELDIAIHNSFFWTDSTCVLRYLANDDRRYKVFVANRVAAIREQSSPSQWKYVNTKLNPADDASRGLSADAIIEDNRWIMGPAFLWMDEEAWPHASIATSDPGEIADEEVKATFATDAVQAPARSIDLEELFKTFSSWMKLKRFVAWILRFKRNLRDLTARGMEKERSASKRKIQPINVEELRQAEKAIIEVVQSKAFKEELLSLKGPPKELKRSSSILRLDPILVDDIICVGGRLQKSSIRARAKHPAIIPKNHHISDLIVRHHHQISGHSGIEHTLSLVRESYWIIKARITLRRVLASCFDCRKRQAPVGRQKMASLPEDRVNPSEPPFSRVGVDCFGPLNVRRGRSVVKRYGVLFTCLSIRAIHIEVAHTLDANSFINALRRFIARRGQPIQMRSDNGGNFVRGEKELREAVRNWNQDKIHNFLLAKNVKWSFNPPTGSHHGGVWERCIRTVRKVIGALAKEQPLDDEGLLTLVCEVEAIVNGRPITKVSHDPRDPEALTPNHLLLLRAGPSLPPGYFENSDNYSRRRWRQVQYLADLFWKRWTREYLPSLQERQKWEKASRNFAVGDVVLVLDESLPRCSWPLGRVIEVFPNRSDGLVRSVRLKTTSSVLVRPVNKLVLLEAS